MKYEYRLIHTTNINEYQKLINAASEKGYRLSSHSASDNGGFTLYCAVMERQISKEEKGAKEYDH